MAHHQRATLSRLGRPIAMGYVAAGLSLPRKPPQLAQRGKIFDAEVSRCRSLPIAIIAKQELIDEPIFYRRA